MANSTRADLRANVRIEIKKDPNGRIWSDTELNSFLKQANLKIQKDWNFQWTENQANTTFSTVSWTQEYSKPTDLGKLQLVRFNGDDLYKTTKVQLKREQNTFVWWTPSKYYIFGSNIGFDVVPNIIWTVDIDYVANLVFPTDDTTETNFPDDFDMAIVKYATFLAWSAMDWKQNTASAKLQEYTLELDTLYSTYIFDDVADLTFSMQRIVQNTGAKVLNR